MANNRIRFSNDFVLKDEKVGINTTDPQALLDVGGELKVSGVSTFSSSVNVDGDLQVDGTSTLGFTTASGLYVSGVSTLTVAEVSNLNVSGASTLTVAEVSNLNVSGASTFTDVDSNQILNSGIATFTNGPILVGSGSSTGTDSQVFQVTGGAYVSGSVGIGTTNPQYKLHVVGDFGATTKSFVIPHPSKSGMKLRYGSLESPYHGIRLTGSSIIKNGSCIVNLPDYICNLVSKEGININITNIKHGKVLWVEEVNIQENKFIVMTEEKVGEYAFYWDFTAIRKDVSNLVTEY